MTLHPHFLGFNSILFNFIHLDILSSSKISYHVRHLEDRDVFLNTQFFNPLTYWCLKKFTWHCSLSIFTGYQLNSDLIACLTADYNIFHSRALSSSGRSFLRPAYNDFTSSDCLFKNTFKPDHNINCYNYIDCNCL